MEKFALFTVGLVLLGLYIQCFFLVLSYPIVFSVTRRYITEYCRYGVKPQTINRSVISFSELMIGEKDKRSK